MAIEIKPYEVSDDGTEYFWHEESNSYAKRLGLGNKIIVLRKGYRSGIEKYVIKRDNKILHSTSDLSSIGIELERLADQNHNC